MQNVPGEFSSLSIEPNLNSANLRWGIGLAGLALFALTGLAVHALKDQYQIGIDLQENACLPVRVAIIKMTPPETIQRGDVLAFRSAKLAPYFDNKQLLAKRVAGLPGDRYEVRNQELSINGKRIAKLHLCDSPTKKPRLCEDRAGQIASGELLMLGDHPKSFDSRYWGVITRSELVGVMVWPYLGGRAE